MQVLELRKRKSTYFKLANGDTSPVWVRGVYDRSSKTYCCHKFDDVNHIVNLKPTRKVYAEFTFWAHMQVSRPSGYGDLCGVSSNSHSKFNL